MKKLSVVLGLLIVLSVQTAQAKIAEKCTTRYSDDMTTTVTCHYATNDMSQVYQHYRRKLDDSEKVYLLANMPTKSIKVAIDSQTQVTYKVSKNQLHIEQSFAGGETSIDFQKKANKVLVITAYSPD